MRKSFTFKNTMIILMVILIIAGIGFIILGIDTYEEQPIDEWIDGRQSTVMNYSNEIEGFSFIITGTVFIIAGFYFIVRLKE